MLNNRARAQGRLDNLIKRLHKVDQFGKYSDQIMKLELDGYSEKVPVEKIPLRDDSVWYLAHHAVVSASKSGKLRVGFDCAAKQGDVSLNNQCFQGPYLNNTLVHVLLRASGNVNTQSLLISKRCIRRSGSPRKIATL